MQTHHAPTHCGTVHRKGVTLLEVLIAGGILVVGLAGVAAILPAAGLILGEAMAADRAASLAHGRLDGHHGLAALVRLRQQAPEANHADSRPCVSIW